MSSEKCVKGKVVTDVEQDLGGGSPRLWGPLAPGGREGPLFTNAVWSLAAGGIVGTSGVKIFRAVSISLPIVLFSVSPEIWMS